MATKDVFDQVFGVSPDLATNGVWVDFGSKLKVKIGFQGEANKTFVKAVELETRQFKRDIEKGTLENEDAKEMLCRILARGVVYDWKGEGVPPYSFEACLDQLKRPNSLFFQEINELSKRLSTFKEQEAKLDAGNSQGDSSAA